MTDVIFYDWEDETVVRQRSHAGVPALPQADDSAEFRSAKHGYVDGFVRRNRHSVVLGDTAYWVDNRTFDYEQDQITVRIRDVSYAQGTPT